MRVSKRNFLVLHAVALTLIVVQGKVREADALIHKPKLLQPATQRTVWTNNKANNNHKPWKSRRQTEVQHHFTFQQREQSRRSMEMSMAHGNIGLEKSKRIPSASLVLVSALTFAALFKTKALISLLQVPGWFLANALYKPYQQSLVNNPLLTKVLTGAILAIAGDAAAQATSGGNSSYDKRRAISFAMFDACYRLFQHNVFPIVIRLGQGNLISRLLPAFFAPAAAAMEQTLMYQFIIVPCLYYPIFFTFTGSIQGLTVTESLARFKRQFFPCWKRNLAFWIPTQMVLFGLVAEKWQIPFACLMGMLWSMVLSNFAGNSKKS